MTDKLREAAQMALDAMLNFPDDISDDMFESIKALRAALAQPEPEPTRSQKLRDAGYTRRPKGWSKDGEEPEPVAWMHTTATGDVYFRKKPHDKVFNPQPVYTAPLQRDEAPAKAVEWQGLTDEEQMQVAWSCGAMSADWLDFARAIEAKLRGKNNA